MGKKFVCGGLGVGVVDKVDLMGRNGDWEEVVVDVGIDVGVVGVVSGKVGEEEVCRRIGI